MSLQFRVFLVTILSVCFFVQCRRDDNTPKPQLVPVSSMFLLYHIQGTDSSLAGGGSLDQTIEDKVKITIKLDQQYQKSSGSYTANIYELNRPDIIGKIGLMPANVANWQSGDIVSVKSGKALAHSDLYLQQQYYVKIVDGDQVIAVGRWGVVP